MREAAFVCRCRLSMPRNEGALRRILRRSPMVIMAVEVLSVQYRETRATLHLTCRESANNCRLVTAR